MHKAVFEKVFNLYKTERSASDAISNISGYALSAQQGSIFLAEAAQVLAYRGGGKTHQLLAALIEDGFYKGLRPNQIDPCPLVTLCSAKRHCGSRPLPCPELWHKWTIAIASEMASAPEDRLAIFNAVFYAPHPKTLSMALKSGLASLPDPLSLQRLAHSVWAQLREVLAEQKSVEAGPDARLSRFNPARPLLITHLCDQLASLPGLAPSELGPDEALATVEAACAFNVGREALALIFKTLPSTPVPQDTLSHWAQLSATSYPGLQAGRALGALYASPLWEPQARESSAHALCAQALKSNDQALFTCLSPHCDWSDLAPSICQTFSPAVLSRLEREALQSKRVSGLRPDAPQERPAPRKARL